MTAPELALVLTSALLHAVWSASIKSSRDPLVFNLLQLATPVALLIALLPWIDFGEVPRAAWAWLAAASAAHGAYFYWMSRAYESGDLTLVYPIARSTPAFLPFIAVPLFGESITPLGALGIAIVVAGMWSVQASQGLHRAAFAGPAGRHAILTLAATVAYSLFDKGGMSALAEADWTSEIPRSLFYCVLISCTSAAIFAPLVIRQRGLREIASAASDEFWRATAASTVSLLGYALILKTLETASVSYVVAVRQSSVLFALLLGVLWLRERPGRIRVIGASATVVGVALIALADGA